MVAAIDPYELLAASLDNHARDDMVDALLARFGGQKLRLLEGRDLERHAYPARAEALPRPDPGRARDARGADRADRMPKRPRGACSTR